MQFRASTCAGFAVTTASRFSFAPVLHTHVHAAHQVAYRDALGIVLGRLFAIAERVLVLFAAQVVRAEQQSALVLHLALDGFHDVVGGLLLTASAVVLDDEFGDRRGVPGSCVDERDVERVAARGARHASRQEQIGVEPARELTPLDDAEVVLVELQAPQLVADRIFLDGGSRRRRVGRAPSRRPFGRSCA